MTIQQGRLRRIGLAAGAAVALAPLIAGAYGRYVELRSPRRDVISVPVPPGHERLSGLLIAFLTDLHFGPFIGQPETERMVTLAMEAHPDLVLLGGDFISESPRYAGDMAAILGPLVAPARLGSYAVLGNHDLSSDRTAVVDALTRHGITVLDNEAVRLETEHGPLWLVGLDDTILGNPAPASAFRAVPPGDAVIVLWHEPDDAAIAAEHGAFLQLSGHTHGGQVRLPFVGPLVLPPGGRKYPAGTYQLAGMTLYVSRGMGAYRPPLRLNCPPEVTLVRLAPPPPVPGGSASSGPVRAPVPPS